MGRSVEQQLAENLGVKLNGSRPVVNGIQLGRVDLFGLAQYEGVAIPQSEEPDRLLEPTKYTRQRFINRPGSEILIKAPHKHQSCEERVAEKRKAIRAHGLGEVSIYILKAPTVSGDELTDIPSIRPGSIPSRLKRVIQI